MRIHAGLLILSLLLLTATAAMAQSRYKPARVLETANAGTQVYVCVETHEPDRLLIGHTTDRRGRVADLNGKVAVVRFDDNWLWVRVGHAKTVRLRQEYLVRAFLPGSRCEQVVDAALERRDNPQKQLRSR